MNVASFIARHIAFNRQRTFSRFIIRLAVTATAVSIAAMILTFAFANGFQYTVAQKVFSIWGHIRVQHYQGTRAVIAEEPPIDPNDTVLRVLHADPDVVSVSVFGTHNAILRAQEGIEGVLLKGVDRNYDFSRLGGFLRAGRWIRFADSGYSQEINLSAYTANQLKLHPGDRTLIYFIQADGTYRVRPMTVAGIFKTGIEDYDKLIAICDINLIRRLSNWGKDQIGGYEVAIRDYRTADSVSERIFGQLPQGWNSRSIEEIYPNIFDWLNLMNKTVAIVLIIMIVVATLNLVTCLIILVLERTPMVGILKALGAPNLTVQQIFLYHGSLILLFGMLIGNIAALAICWIQDRFGIVKLNEDAYFISKAVARPEWWHLVLVNGGSFIVCFLVLMIPTLIIRRIRPVRAIRFQ